MSEQHHDSLVSRAKAISTKRPVRASTPAFEDRLDLALAWARGEITAGQVRSVLDYTSSSNICNAMGATIASAIRKRVIEIVDKRPGR